MFGAWRGRRGTPRSRFERRSRCAHSMAQALRLLGLRPAGGNHGTLKKRSSGATSRPSISIRYWALRSRRAPSPAIPLELILVEHSTYHRNHLKRRLYDAGLKARECELCGQGEEWRGRSMALILDHINGVPNDNRFENLQIVCPNCAATLDTHCGRKNRRDRNPRSCLWCGATFVPKYTSHRYCSPGCGEQQRGASRTATGTPQGRAALLRTADGRRSGDELRGDRAQVWGLGQRRAQVDSLVRVPARNRGVETRGCPSAARRGLNPRRAGVHPPPPIPYDPGRGRACRRDPCRRAGHADAFRDAQAAPRGVWSADDRLAGGGCARRRRRQGGRGRGSGPAAAGLAGRRGDGGRAAGAARHGRCGQGGGGAHRPERHRHRAERRSPADHGGDAGRPGAGACPVGCGGDARHRGARRSERLRAGGAGARRHGRARRRDQGPGRRHRARVADPRDQHRHLRVRGRGAARCARRGP